MRNLLLVTHVNFWEPGAGHKARISSLVNHLKTKVRITLAFVGSLDQTGTELLNHLYPEIESIALGDRPGCTYRDYRNKFEVFYRGKLFDLALIEYIEMSFVLPFLNKDCVTFLDMHDLVFERIESFRQNDLHYDGIHLSKTQEFQIFDCFDYVIAIQRREFEKVIEGINPLRVLLTPHPVNISKMEIRPVVKNIGYLASAYSPNIDAIHWFLKNVWPKLSTQYNVSLNIYGLVCLHLEKALSGLRSVILHGLIENVEEAYRNNDVIINPVRCGAGLKIKNVEALGSGLPLVTTPHGAIGMDDGRDFAFLVAENIESFTDCLEKLIKNFNFRKLVASKAYQYALDHFSPAKCYGDLLRAMTDTDLRAAAGDSHF
ncbi:MAG TPA: glycosyltransferase [Chryseolinea sp.]|nr:glycosyltransferase [Chryseolinea sp.]